MTNPGYRSVKELGLRPPPRRQAGVDPQDAQESLAEKSRSLRETLTRVQMDAARRRAGVQVTDPSMGDSVAEEQIGVPNPFGSSTRAFEPNTAFLDSYASAYDSSVGARQRDEAASALQGGGLGVSGGTPVVQATGQAKSVIDAAMRMVGKMYVWGGASASGTDCSGLIYYAMKSAGVDWKRYRAVDYRNLGQAVSKEEARPGDVVYIDNPNSDTDHVGIYIGNGQMIESPTSGQRTKVSAVGNRATSYRRILNDDSIARSMGMGGTPTWLYNNRPWNVAGGNLFTAPARPTGSGPIA